MNKVVVITGASAGIGAATAELLSKQGVSLALLARREDKLKQVAEKCGPNTLVVKADAANREEIRNAVNRTIDRFRKIDVWINNVGQGISRPPSQLTEEDIDDMIRLNVKSALYGMQEVLPHFKAAGEGHIINISSMLGRVPFAMIRSAYCGAKHFLNALTATFREEIQQTHPNIQFSIVSPPVVRTDFGLNALHGGPDSRTLPNSQSAEEVAAVIAQVIESRLADVYTMPGAHDRVVAYYSTLGTDAKN